MTLTQKGPNVGPFMHSGARMHYFWRRPWQASWLSGW